MAQHLVTRLRWRDEGVAGLGSDQLPGLGPLQHLGRRLEQHRCCPAQSCG